MGPTDRFSADRGMAADPVLDGVASRAAFSAIKREVARIEGRIGRLAAKTYR